MLSCVVDNAAEGGVICWLKTHFWAKYICCVKTWENENQFGLRLLFRFIDQITVTEFRGMLDLECLHSKTSKHLRKCDFVELVGGIGKYRDMEYRRYQGTNIIQLPLLVNDEPGPIAKDQAQWLEEQETDVDDPDEGPKPSAFRVAYRKMLQIREIERENASKKRYSSDLGPAMTIDGELGDPETHKRKQRRLEAEIAAKLANVANETETEIDEPK